MTAYLAGQFAVGAGGMLRCTEDGRDVWQIEPGTTLAELIGAAARHSAAGCASQAEATASLRRLGVRLDQLRPEAAARWMGPPTSPDDWTRQDPPVVGGEVLDG